MLRGSTTATRRGGGSGFSGFQSESYIVEDVAEDTSSSSAEQRRRDALRQLEQQFPDISPAEVREVYDNCGCDIARAEEQLEQRARSSETPTRSDAVRG